LVRSLLGRHRTWWVNTIGTRTPRLDWATAVRGLEKIRHWFRPKRGAGEALPPNLHVLNPKMWPWFGSSLSRRLNRNLLTSQLTPLLSALPEAAVAVTTLPLVSELIGELPVRRWVYYCVDDFGQWPGLDQRTLQHMERRLIERADAIIAVSETLQDRLAKLGRASHLLTHGVDLDFWSNPEQAPAIPQLDALQRPLVVFWGVLDRRMDTALVEGIANSMSQGTIVLAGPADAYDPALDRMPRVHRLGPLAFAQLPALAHQAAALVMPYADLPVTRAIQPLKLKEYLATGKPVVVRDLPATRAWSDCLDLADAPEAFANAVRLRLATGTPPDQQAARLRLEEESWETKAHDFERCLFDGEAG
jgi:glycosyltransferase involved in cell wall biosynthesis